MKGIEGVLRKAASSVGLMNYKHFSAALGDNVQTNMTFDEMVHVQKNYHSALGEVEQLHFQKGNDLRKNGIWYYLMDKGELREICVGCLHCRDCCLLTRLHCLLSQFYGLH